MSTGDLFAGEKWSHKALCDIAVKWLQRPSSGGGPSCLIAVSEVAGGWSGEIPDAIGFCLQGGEQTGSVLVEVKVSRADFLGDRKKPHRQPGKGMGVWRYYMAPEGMIREDELPSGWGLVSVNSRGHCKVLTGAHKGSRELGYCAYQEQIVSWRQAADTERETWLLVKLLSRLGDVDKLKRQRRDEFAAIAGMGQRLDEVNEILRAARNEHHKTDRELRRYKKQYGELPAEVDEFADLQKRLANSCTA